MLMLRPVMTVACVSLIGATMLGCKRRAYNSANIRSERPTADNCGTPGAPNNPNPAHCEGPVYFEGEYTFVDDLDTLNFDKGEPIPWEGKDGSAPFVSKLFGTTTLYSPEGTPLPSQRTGKPHIIRDLQYLVGPNKVGLKIIPVTVGTGAEAKPYTSGYTKPVQGSNILDSKILENQGLPPDAPVFAAAVYLYPGAQFVRLPNLASKKSQGSIGHMSVYIGDGVSKHSPRGLHDERWSVAGTGEPSTIISLSLEGAKQLDLNKNMIAWARIINELNEGPNFPGDFEFDPVRISNLQVQTEFARKWITGGKDVEALRSDPYWGTYCAESANMIINLGMNVPLTEEGFVKVWAHENATKTSGDNAKAVAYAKALFRKVKERYLTEISPKEWGEPPTAADIDTFKFIDTTFTPLWEQLKVSPLSTKTNEGFPFPLDTTTDLAAVIVQNFASWADVGPAVSAMAIASLAEQFKERIQVDPIQFMTDALPVMAAGFLAHAGTQSLKTDAEVAAYIEREFATPGFPAQLASLLKPMVERLAATMKRDTAVSVEEAWSQYVEAVRPILQRSQAWAPKLSVADQKALRMKHVAELIRTMETMRDAGDTGLQNDINFLREFPFSSLRMFVKFNSPPSLLFRVATSLKQRSDKVKVSIVGTIFGASMVREKKPGEEARFELDELRALLPKRIADIGKGVDSELIGSGQ